MNTLKRGWFILVAFVAIMVTLACGGYLRADEVSRPCLNCAAPSAEAELGVISVYTDGAWKVGPRLLLKAEAGPSIGQGEAAKTPCRFTAEASIGLRTGDSGNGDTTAGGVPDITSATSVRGAVGIERVFGSREYEPALDATDKRLKKVLTSIYAKAGGEFIPTDKTIEPRLAKQYEAGIRIQAFRASQRTADVTVGVGLDETAIPSEPIVLSDGSIAHSIQAIVAGKLPVIQKGAISGAVVGRIVTNLIRSENDGRRDRVEIGVVVNWD
jgi:hypothetical protein